MSFSKSSRNIQLQGNSVLSAQCERADGQSFAPSTLDLNTCLGNIDGSFKWGEKDYSLTARDVSLDGTNLSAKLQRADGVSERHATVDLDERIENHDGNLRFKR
ncbi:CVNH domain protein [Ceratobasidium sp. AG-Ba]|nr:CVNH domain protein [Ceratobasidium sp. AG-Ba]QRW07736.1 CVNH domain protein [Ceratobasidium sp. AG-Ba]